MQATKKFQAVLGTKYLVQIFIILCFIKKPRPQNRVTLCTAELKKVMSPEALLRAAFTLLSS